MTGNKHRGIERILQDAHFNSWFGNVDGLTAKECRELLEYARDGYRMRRRDPVADPPEPCREVLARWGSVWRVAHLETGHRDELEWRDRRANSLIPPDEWRELPEAKP